MHASHTGRPSRLAVTAVLDSHYSLPAFGNVKPRPFAITLSMKQKCNAYLRKNHTLCQRHVNATNDAINAFHTGLTELVSSRRGCKRSPHPWRDEAYVSLFYGNTRSHAFDGLKVLVHSLRLYDRLRRVIVMLPTGSIDEFETMTQSEPARRMKQLFEPLSFRRVTAIGLHNINAHFHPSSKCFQLRQQMRFQESSSSLSGANRSFNASNSTRDREGYLRTDILSKWHVFSLVEFTRVLYLDADVLIGGSLEALWQTQLFHKEIAAAVPTIDHPLQASFRTTSLCELHNSHDSKYQHNRTVRRNRMSTFNTGVILLRPNLAIHRAAIQIFNDSGRYLSCNALMRTSDQWLYNTNLFVFHTRCLPYSFNCRMPAALNASHETARAAWRQYDCHNHDSSSGLPHISHFALMTKPWKVSPELRNVSVIYRKWFSHLRVYDSMAVRSLVGLQRSRLSDRLADSLS